MISYENINIVSNVSTIIDDIPFILIETEIDFIVLKFIKYEIITGIITECTSYKIDLLIYNTFNAQIDISNDENKELFLKVFKIDQKYHFKSININLFIKIKWDKS